MTKVATAGRRLIVVLALIPLASCERVKRYGPAQRNEEPTPTKVEIDVSTARSSIGWRGVDRGEPRGVPIAFVPSTSERWRGLTRFWNPPSPTVALLPIGQPPHAALVSTAVASAETKVDVKVPLGLPDPTSFIPDANPMSFDKWRLGKELFFDLLIDLPETSLSCSSCHQPNRGFSAATVPAPYAMPHDTQSLINCVYNRRQFRDGRVETLEQTIVRDPDDEEAGPDPKTHRWGGIVIKLREDNERGRYYRMRFREVFDILEPTQDAVAKALATYMRTILSGNSIIDRAKAERDLRADGKLLKRHIEAVLSDAELQGLQRPDNPRKIVEAIHSGHVLFIGKARCVLCHQGPLYTDHDFHNIGIDRTDAELLAGKGMGRFDAVPVGLKERRLIGAFRTPTLRSLLKTPPFMHAGQLLNLPLVLEHYDHGIDAWRNRFVDRRLLDSDGQAHRLKLDAHETEDLKLFLAALDGSPVPAVVSRKPLIDFKSAK